MSLLVVEDEERVRGILKRGLTEEGYDIDEVGDGAEALTQLQQKPGCELVLLDWMLPTLSGLDVLKTLRGRGDMTPVIMLTAKDAVADRISALNAGADDYLIKPFAFEELLARVRAVIRRAGKRQSPVLTYEDLTLNPLTRRVQRADKDIRLTAREFSLLQFFLEHPDEVLSRARIVEAVWEHDFETFSNVVEVYIRYVRTKMDEPFEHKLIHTVRGVGYVLRKEP